MKIIIIMFSLFSVFFAAAQNDFEDAKLVQNSSIERMFSTQFEIDNFETTLTKKNSIVEVSKINFIDGAFSINNSLNPISINSISLSGRIVSDIFSETYIDLQEASFFPTDNGDISIGINSFKSESVMEIASVENKKVNDIINNLIIYPNPTSSILNISNTNNFEIKNIAVVDINGRVVKNQNGALTEINVSDLNTGVYFVTIETNEGKATKKFMKQ